MLGRVFVSFLFVNCYQENLMWRLWELFFFYNYYAKGEMKMKHFLIISNLRPSLSQIIGSLLCCIMLRIFIGCCWMPNQFTYPPLSGSEPWKCMYHFGAARKIISLGLIAHWASIKWYILWQCNTSSPNLLFAWFYRGPKTTSRNDDSVWYSQINLA